MNTSIYIKEPLLVEAKQKAKSEGVSLSKLVEKALEQRLSDSVPSFPLKSLSNLNGIVKFGGDAVEDCERWYE
jgi:hypothetical protein